MSLTGVDWSMIKTGDGFWDSLGLGCHGPRCWIRKRVGLYFHLDWTWYNNNTRALLVIEIIIGT